MMAIDEANENMNKEIPYEVATISKIVYIECVHSRASK